MRIDSNGRINLLAGTAANPTLNAGLSSSDTNTGIYFPAADTIGIVTGGIEIIRLSGNTISFSGGTVSLPAINAGLFSNDTNTGIYFPAADTIGFVEGAAEAMRINSSGNVGIGTTAQTARLQVHTTGSTVLGQSQLYLSGTTLVRIDLAGNGTDTPKFSATTESQRSVGEKINLYPKLLISNTCLEYTYLITGSTGTFGTIYYTGCTAPSDESIAVAGGDSGTFCATKVILDYDNASYTGSPYGGMITQSTSGNCQQLDYSFGVSDVLNVDGQLWYTVPASNGNYAHSFYGGVTELLRIRGNGQTSFQGGSVSLPVISAGLNTGDTNTGIYFPAADTIGFATSGTSRGIINNTGYGIQTTPSEWIHLSSDPASSKYLLIDAAQNSNNPDQYWNGSVFRLWGTTQDDWALGTPDYWMEIQLNGIKVLIPCYLPEP
jgi:hypothetical protein